MPAQHPRPIGSETIKWRLFLLGVIGPLIGISIGVDGGDIFQILAVDTLELDTRTVGSALLAGALSIPIQILAARIPLTRARHHIRLFLWLMGAMALATALLVAWAPPGSWIAGLVLVVAVLAEICVSVLFATAWQPLISYTLTVPQRQFMIGRARATTGIALLGGAVLFGQLGQAGRAVFVAALGLVAIAVGWSLHVLPPPPSSAPSSAAGPDRPEPVDDSAGASSSPAGGSMTNIFIALPAVAFSGWPLLVSYAAVVMWPDGNLGLLAGAMALGGVTASALWRDPGPRLILLIRITAAILAACSFGIVVAGSPVRSTAGAAGLLAVVAVGSAARTAQRTAIMELAHRRIDTTNAVRVMTLIDVVGSTSFQVGAFAAGFLIAASTTSTWAVDPYRIWLVVASLALVAASARFRDAN